MRTSLTSQRLVVYTTALDAVARNTTLPRPVDGNAGSGRMEMAAKMIDLSSAFIRCPANAYTHALVL